MGLYTNKNVRLMLISGFFFSIASSIYWFSPTWLIYSLGGSNADLGTILGTATLVSLVVTFASSILADRYRRDVFIWISGIIMATGMFIMSNAEDLNQLFIAQIITASGFAMFGPSAAGLFANSIPAGNRNRVFGTQFLITTFSSAGGNIITYFLFLGSTSQLSSLDSDLLRLSLLIATLLMVISIIINFFIKDENTITEEEEGTVATNYISVGYNPNKSRFFNFKRQFSPGALPIIALSVLSGILIGFGAGTSVPYFPRFFFDIYGLNLSNLSLVFAGLTILTAIWGKINSNLADRFGRVELIVVNQLLAVVLLYILAIYPPLILALLTLFVRNAVMNGAWPLSNAIQMEYTPRRLRSKLIAIGTISWSAMFGIGQITGGRLVDLVGFWLPFIITATLYLIATILYWRIKKYQPEDPKNIQVKEKIESGPAVVMIEE